MATVTTTIPLTSVYTPYERPPQAVTLWTAIPRALQSFVAVAEPFPLKPAGDDYILSLTATLPPNFGYVMNSGFLMIDVDRAADFRAEVLVNLQNFYRNADFGLSATINQGFVNHLPASRSIDVRQAWPTFPLEAFRGTAGILLNSVVNNENTNAMAAGIVNAYFSFWQFDLEQLRKYPINSPVPTHAR